MPSHLPFLPPRVRRWFAHSDPMTRREFYTWLTILFAYVTFCLWGVKQLSDGRVLERKRADYRGCVYTREHVVKPDRATVLTSPYSSVPILKQLDFTDKQIEAYLKAQYAGVDPRLLEQKPPDGLGLTHKRAREITSGKGRGSTATELRRRPIPNCQNPDAPKPPGSPTS